MRDVDIEHAAQLIYAVVQRFRTDGKIVPWVDGGNSLVQDECRLAARLIVERHRGDVPVQPSREPAAWRIDALPPHTWVTFTNDAAVADANRVAGWPVTPLFELPPLLHAGAPVPRLREVLFKNGYWHRVRDGVLEQKLPHSDHWVPASLVNMFDMGAYEALKVDSTEPVETVDDILSDYLNTTELAKVATRLRAAVLAEAPNAGAGR
jgi:hypothetical protein